MIMILLKNPPFILRGPQAVHAEPSRSILKVFQQNLDSYKALRNEYNGAHYQVTSWRNERKVIFRDDTDREKSHRINGSAQV
jgi:hypothetical protein